MEEKSKKITSRNSRINLSHTLSIFKQSSRNSRINLSHTPEGNKPNQLTIIQLHANIEQQKLIYYSRKASKLVKLKSQRTIQP